jgi:Domain of unknown function (DUF5658)
MHPLLAFLLLQGADFATTMAAISCGGAEKNPLVAHMIGLGGVEGLLLAKLVSLAIGATAALTGKYRGIRIANVVFAGIVVWNISIISRLLVS